MECSWAMIARRTKTQVVSIHEIGIRSVTSNVVKQFLLCLLSTVLRYKPQSRSHFVFIEDRQNRPFMVFRQISTSKPSFLLLVLDARIPPSLSHNIQYVPIISLIPRRSLPRTVVSVPVRKRWVRNAGVDMLVRTD